MASNARPERTLGTPLSIEGGAPEFLNGEYVLVRIPIPIKADGLHLNDESTIASELPPTLNGSSPQHFAFISEVKAISVTSYALVVYPVLSFSRSGGALEGYNLLSDTAKAWLLPLPPLTLRHPTPALFGPPITLGDWTNSRESWLYIVPHRFVMPASRPFRRMNPRLFMPLTTLHLIHLYGQRCSNIHITDTNRHHDQPHPPPDSGGGGEQGSGNPRPVLMEERGGGSGETLVARSPTIVGDGEGGLAPKEKLVGFADTTHHGIPILEGVDEDGEGADATFRDDLMLLASYNPMWMVELNKYLEEEEKERRQVQKERAVRLADWLEEVRQPGSQGIPGCPTFST